ncbi:hypothetical protein B0H63DRAFT_514181 [Podospora didyma]|uniref:C2H2-type domain-containing protein n=1 Tax=Podospora didyma TaxID=330526 RepID=A0AAE0K601_9PEZI|nr:hypothetical protein B0H63DRAFT_514181 [Podospora didyma]
MMSKDVTCEECGKVCSSRHTLWDHRRNHVKKHLCDNTKCQLKTPPVRFATTKDLQRHQQVHHHSRKKRICSHCQIELAWRLDNYKRHLNTYHNGGIIAAVCKGDEEVVRWLLVNFPGCANKRDGGKRTPLFLAASLGFEKIVGLLLDNGVDIEERSLLIRRGAETNYKTRMLDTASSRALMDWDYHKDSDLSRSSQDFASRGS